MKKKYIKKGFALIENANPNSKFITTWSHENIFIYLNLVQTKILHHQKHFQLQKHCCVASL